MLAATCRFWVLELGGLYPPFEAKEHFRENNNDVETELAQRRAAAEQLTDLLLGWFESELGEQANFDRLRRFIDEDLRRDLKNLAVYAWAASATMREEEKPGETESWIRIWLYLCERGYLSAKDLPKLVRAVSQGDLGPLLRIVQRVVARTMGIPDNQPIPKSLAFLAGPDEAKASCGRC